MLPAYLSAVSAWARLDASHLLLRATGFPLVSLTLAPPDRSRLMTAMYSNRGENVATITRLGPSRLALSHFLKSCPMCIEEDKRLYGISTWRTEHQFCGIAVCPTHQLRLNAVTNCEGGINRQLKLPVAAQPAPADPPSAAEIRFAEYISRLHHYLCSQSPLVSLNHLYYHWLGKQGYLTSHRRLRWKMLQADLKEHWQGLFSPHSCLPEKLSSFDFIPRLVHGEKPVHYVKHVLLMNLISPDPQAFFHPETTSVDDDPIPVLAALRADTQSIVNPLNEGKSLRKVASSHDRSVGFVKQLARRHGIHVERRTQFIGDSLERAIWRKAFYGVHRSEIAKAYRISISAVEVVIQSHSGLSQWRAHLLKAKRKMKYRATLASHIRNNPTSTRSEVRKSCGAAFMWLYKHDKNWLYETLPPTTTRTYHPSVDWAHRDATMSAQLQDKQRCFKSLSEIDRFLGGHGWLLSQRERLPNTISAAQKLLKTQRSDR